MIFLGVDLQDTDANAIAYENHYGVPYPSVNDASEVITSEYNVLDPPTVVIVDSKGNIVDRFLGTLAGVSADLTRLTEMTQITVYGAPWCPGLQTREAIPRRAASCLRLGRHRPGRRRTAARRRVAEGRAIDPDDRLRRY